MNKYFKADAEEFGFYSEDLMDYLAEGGNLQNRTDVPDSFKELYLTASDISHADHVGMQAAFQEHCDSGISKTINLAPEATRADVWDAYVLAWKSGCKGITVYRAGSREKEVLVSGHNNAPTTTKCCDLPFLVMADGCESCKNCGWSACAIA